MIKLEMLMNSGAVQTVHVSALKGTPEIEAAESFTEYFSKLDMFSSQDASSGAWFYVRCHDVSFITATVV